MRPFWVAVPNKLTIGETMNKQNARVCYNSLTDYNKGNLVFKWFDLDGKTSEEHSEELAEWLTELTDNSADGELREEWEIADTENVPNHLLNFGVDAFIQYQEHVDVIGKDALDAAISLGVLHWDQNLNEYNHTPEELICLYMGSFDAWDVPRQLAEFIDDNSGLLDEMPEHLQAYFDFESYGRDLLLNTYCEDNGHVFQRV